MGILSTRTTGSTTTSVMFQSLKRPQRIEPGPGQESVWDYPRPPRLEKVNDKLRVIFGGETIAETTQGYRVLETSHPPMYYIPVEDVKEEFIEPINGSSTYCEFKGSAKYWTLNAGGKSSLNAAWSYPNPTKDFDAIKGYLAFYASKVDACYVGDEKVQAQSGDYYGGWITSKVVGPFKGEPGTRGW